MILCYVDNISPQTTCKMHRGFHYLLFLEINYLTNLLLESYCHTFIFRFKLQTENIDFQMITVSSTKHLKTGKYVSSLLASMKSFIQWLFLITDKESGTKLSGRPAKVKEIFYPLAKLNTIPGFLTFVPSHLLEKSQRTLPLPVFSLFLAFNDV